MLTDVMPLRPMRIAALAATAALTLAIFVLPSKAATDAGAVVKTYADIALAGYEDSLGTAKALDAAIDALIAKPSAETLAAAKEAWKAARIPYQQTEAYRFGNAIVDDWEGRVSAWPLDEGLIDYMGSLSYSDALVDQTTSIERAVAALELDAIEFEGSDSLDAPDEVFE